DHQPFEAPAPPAALGPGGGPPRGSAWLSVEPAILFAAAYEGPSLVTHPLQRGAEQDQGASVIRPDRWQSAAGAGQELPLRWLVVEPLHWPRPKRRGWRPQAAIDVISYPAHAPSILRFRLGRIAMPPKSRR